MRATAQPLLFIVFLLRHLATTRSSRWRLATACLFMSTEIHAKTALVSSVSNNRDYEFLPLSDDTSPFVSSPDSVLYYRLAPPRTIIAIREERLTVLCPLVPLDQSHDFRRMDPGTASPSLLPRQPSSDFQTQSLLFQPTLQQEPDQDLGNSIAPKTSRKGSDYSVDISSAETDPASEALRPNSEWTDAVDSQSEEKKRPKRVLRHVGPGISFGNRFRRDPTSTGVNLASPRSTAQYEAAVDSDKPTHPFDVPPNMKIEWVTKLGETINDTRRWVTPNGTLVFEKVVTEDAGSYRCRLVSNSDVLVSSATMLSIATVGNWSLYPANTEVTQGGGVRMACHLESTPPARVQWYRNGTLIGPQDRYFFPKQDILQIKDASLGDAGSYWCSGFNPIMNQTSNSSKGQLQVVSRKNSYKGRSSKRLQTGTRIHEQNVNDPPRTENNGPSTEFSPEDSKQKHNDQYLAPSSEFQVDTLNSSQNNFSTSWGLPHASSSISPHRTSVGNSQDTPFVYRADMPELKDIRGGNLQSEIFPQDLQPSDNNTLGNDSNWSEGRVLSPYRSDPFDPHADSQHRDSSYNCLPLPRKEIVIVGSRAVLECMTDSYENQRSFNWSRARNHNISTRVQTVGQGSLLWEHVEREDAGDYICNLRRDSCLTIHYELRVLEPPTLNKSSLYLKVPNGGKVNFACTALAVPDLHFQWYKDGVRLCSGSRVSINSKSKNGYVNSTVNILYTRLQDQGVYQCFAVTSLGEVSAAGRLEIIPSPIPLPNLSHLEVTSVSSTSVRLQWHGNTSGHHRDNQVENNRVSKDSEMVYLVLYEETDISWTTFNTALPVPIDPAPNSHGDCAEDDSSSSKKNHQFVENGTSKIIENLKPYTNYSFYVRFGSVGEQKTLFLSEPSNVLTLRTPSGVPEKYPDVFSITPLSDTILRVQWKRLTISEAAGKVMNQTVFWRHAGTYLIGSHVEKSNPLGPEQTEYNIVGVLPHVKYCVVVEAANELFPPNPPSAGDWKCYPNEDVRPSVFLEVYRDQSEVPLMHLKVYVKAATSTKHHVQSFLLKYNCSGDQVHERTLLAEDSYLQIPGLAPSSCCSVSALSVLPNTAPKEQNRAHSSLCLQRTNHTGIGSTPPLGKLAVLSWISGTDVIMSWEATHQHPGQYFVVYLEKLKPIDNTKRDTAELRAGRADGVSRVERLTIPWVRLTTATHVRLAGLMADNWYRVTVELCTEQLCYLPRDTTSFLTLNTPATAPLHLRWAPLTTSKVRLTWAPPQHARAALTTYVVRYSSMYGSQSVVVEGGLLQCELDKLISNTPYEVSVAAVVNGQPGDPTNTTCNIVAYLQTITINWTLYVLIVVVVVEGLALLFYFCMLRRRGHLTLRNLLSVAFSKQGSKAPVEVPLAEVPNGCHHCGFRAAEKKSVLRLMEYPMDSKGPQLSPVRCRSQGWADADQGSQPSVCFKPDSTKNIIRASEAIYSAVHITPDETEENTRDLLSKDWCNEHETPSSHGDSGSQVHSGNNDHRSPLTRLSENDSKRTSILSRFQTLGEQEEEAATDVIPNCAEDPEISPRTNSSRGIYLQELADDRLLINGIGQKSSLVNGRQKPPVDNGSDDLSQQEPTVANPMTTVRPLTYDINRMVGGLPNGNSRGNGTCKFRNSSQDSVPTQNNLPSKVNSESKTSSLFDKKVRANGKDKRLYPTKKPNIDKQQETIKFMFPPFKNGTEKSKGILKHDGVKKVTELNGIQRNGLKCGNGSIGYHACPRAAQSSALATDSLC